MRHLSRTSFGIPRLLFTLSFFAASAFSAGPTYVFHDLIFPNPPNDTTTLTAVYGVNDSGTVVGYYNTLNDRNNKLGLYGSTVPSVNLLNLTLTNGSPSCSPTQVGAAGINNAGTIAGAINGCSNNGSFLTTNNGSTFADFTPTGITSGSLIFNQATGVNSSGIVAGYAIGQSGLSFTIQGYTTSDESTFTPISDPNGPTATFVAGIDNNGDLVGFYLSNPSNTNSKVGYLLKNGVYYDVFPPSTANAQCSCTPAQSDATGIDSAGDIVGFYQDPSGLSYGFIWTGYTLSGGAVTGGTFTTLTDANAGNNGGNGEGTQVLGISPNGSEIVGLYKNSSTTNGFYAITNSSTTTLTSLQNPSTYDTPVTFTASVTPSTATGTVILNDGSTELQTATLSGGQAIFTISSPPLSVGTHSISAVYQGDSTYGGSTSNTVTQTVNQATTTTSVTSSTGTNASSFGQQVTFTATVSNPVRTPAGSVTFSDGSNTLGTVSLNGSGQATFSTTALSVGPHTISATYNGSTDYATSTGNLSGWPGVIKANTTTGVTTSGSPSTYGGSVTFTATVTPSSGSNPTGSVTFSDGSTTLQTVSLSGGQAQYTTSTLAAGSHTIQVAYSGDGNFNTSSGNVAQTVNKASTTTSLSSSVNPSSQGQSVTFTAIVSPATATGSITLTIDSTPQVVPLSAGQAQLTVSNLTVGSHTIGASYGGDSNFLASTATNVTQTVNPAGSLVLSSLLNPSVYGQSVTFTTTLPGGTTGTITFSVDSGTGIPVTISSNQAQYTTAALSVGSHSISATYSGSSSIVPATVNITQTVNKAPTTTGLSSSAPNSSPGQSVTLTATVTPSTATGQVAFSIDGGTPTNVPVTGGQAQFAVSNLTAGGHSIQAVYGGDTNYSGSSASFFTLSVGKLISTTTLSSNGPSTYGQSLAFTAAVTTGATGSVTFSVDGAPQQTLPLTGNQAQFVTTALAVGTHTILATYSGSTTYASSNNGVSQTVNKAAGTVGLSSSTGSPSAINQAVTFKATVPAGATGTITFVLDGGAGVPVAITNGQAQFTPPTLSGGSHSLVASYSGDVNFNAGSGTFTQVVSQLAVGTVTLTSSSNPATYGLVVTITATVPAGATGMITFTVDGKSQAPITLTGTQAQFAASNLSVGSHSISATYGGNPTFQGATSALLTEVINQGLGNVGISASPSPSALGQTVTFLATVPVGATGTITFSIDGLVQKSVAVTSGQASFSTASLSFGSHTINATYSGDSNFAAGSNSVVQVVGAATQSLVSLTSSQNPSVVGQPVTFTIAVSSAAIASAVNGVPVAFYDGTTPLGLATAQNGQASLTTSALLAGSHTIVAQVPGTSVQLSVGQVVNGMPTATTISAAPSPAISGQPVTLTALVGPASGKPPAGTPAPTGQVIFQDNGASVGTANLSATGATLSVNSLAAGAHQFTAIYSGDKFWGSSFGRVSDTANAPSVQLSSAAAPLSLGFAPDETVSFFNVPGLTGNTTSSLPLGTSLAGVSVSVTDSAGVSRAAQIYGVYASAGQINLVIPSGTATGQATVTITFPGGNTATATITIADAAPTIYSASMDGKGVFAGQIVYVHSDGSQTLAGSANPVVFTSGDQIFLTLYGTGIRHYASGVTATVNGVTVTAQAAAQGTYPGLDQINLGPLPSSLAGSGTANIVITVDGQAANTVTVTIQ